MAGDQDVFGKGVQRTHASLIAGPTSTDGSGSTKEQGSSILSLPSLQLTSVLLGAGWSRDGSSLDPSGTDSNSTKSRESHWSKASRRTRGGGSGDVEMAAASVDEMGALAKGGDAQVSAADYRADDFELEEERFDSDTSGHDAAEGKLRR